MKRVLNFVVMAVMAQFLVLRIAAMFRDGFTTPHLVWAHVYLVGIAIALVWELHGRKVWEERERAESAFPVVPNVAKAQATEERLVSLVLLLARPVVGAVDGERAVDGKRYAITFTDRPYVKDRDAEAKLAATPALGEAIRRHEAWCSVDAIDRVPDQVAAYRTIGKLLADLSTGADVLAIFCPEDGRMTAWDAEMVKTLRSGDPRAVFPSTQAAVA